MWLNNKGCSPEPLIIFHISHFHKKGSRAALRGKMSPLATIGGLYTTKKLSIINNLSSFNDVASRVFDTPDIGAPKLFVHVIY
jgi:hypothetical protein